jgi:hypothetical protein
MRLEIVMLLAGALGGTPARAAGQATPATSTAPAAPAVATGDVRSRGARGDGVADDTAAIQAACAAGGDVVLPAGTYLVTRPISLSGRVRILGAGATVVSSAPTGEVFVAAGDLAGFVMRDVALRTTRKDLDKRGGALFAVDHRSVRSARFEGVTFDTGSSYQNGLSLAAQVGTVIEDVTIRDCRFTGASAGIEIVQHVDLERRVTGVRILGNRFAYNGLKDEQVAGFGVSLSGRLSTVEVSGNDIRGYPYAGIEVVAPKAGGFDADYVIHANTVVGTGRGIITDTANLGPSGHITRLSIRGNVVVDNRYFQRFQGLADSIVQGNVFDTRWTTPAAQHQFDFFGFLDSDRILVADNQFRLELPPEEAGKALLAFNGVTNSHVTGNRVECSGARVVRIGSPARPSTDNSFSANRLEQRDGGAASEPVAFVGPGTTRNVLSGTTIVTRHEGAFSSQAAGNVASATVTVRSDTGVVDTTSGARSFAIPPAGR